VKDESGQAGGLGAQLGSAWRDAISPIGPFLKDQNSRLIAQTLIFFSLLAGILVARSRSGSGTDAGPDTEIPAIFARPVSAAFISTLVLDRVFRVSAPETFIVLVRAASILPLLRLAPRMLPARYVGPITFVALLYLLDVGEFLLVGDAALHRAHLLAVSLLGLGVTIVFIGRERREPVGREHQLRLVSGAIIAFLFAVGCITNIYGAVELARVVTDDLLSAFYIVIVVIIAMRVLEDVTGIALSHAPLQNLRSVRKHQAMLQRRVSLVIRAGIIVLGARAMLGTLGLERPLVHGFLALMNAGGTIGALTLTLGDFVAFFFTLWMAFQVSRYLQFVLGEDVLPGISLPRGVNQTIVRLTHYAVVTLGFLLAVAASGMDVSKLAILAGGLGVGLGFGLQSIVNNFLSGLILMFERPIQVGDTIEVGDLIGRVKSIGIRASTVRTYSGAEVVVPNANLVASEVVNWTLSDRLRRIELPLGVAYGSDPEQVSEILLAAAGAHEDALTRPQPLAVFLGFGDSSLKFELRFWTREFEEWQRIRGEVATQVQRSLAAAGIEIPFPQRTLHLKSEDRPPVGQESPES
jgi:small-conductance mechanosensitive channel